MSQSDDESSLYASMRDFFGQKAEEVEGDDGDGTDESTGDDAGQKQPPEGDGGGDDPVEDLVRALADELGKDPDDLMAAIDAAGQRADDEMHDDEEDEEDDEDEEVGQDADDGTDASVSIDFGAKADEHGLVDESTLDEKLDAVREDLGQKIAESLDESVQEVAQKMDVGGTPTPAGGSFQDEEDFESHLDAIADKEGW